MKKEFNYYLVGLPVFGIVFICFLIYMVRLSLQYPVEMDSSHMMPYRELDKDYNQIAESEKKFNELYSVSTIKPILFKDTPARLELNISDKSGKAVNAKITALVTRPDTSKYDIKVNEFNKTDLTYTSNPFSVNLEGRWKIIYKIEVGSLQKFTDLESFAKKAQ